MVSVCSKIENQIQKIDTLLDQEIQWVQGVLENKKRLDYSLINNDLVYHYNEMLTLSYTLKLWLLDGVLCDLHRPEELLAIAKDQFQDLLCLTGRSKVKECNKTVSLRCIQPYQRLDQAM